MALHDAYEAGSYAPYGPAWKMHHGHTRSWPHEVNDWSRVELPSTRPSPRHRRWDGEIPRPAFSVYSAAPSSVATSRQRPAPTRAASVLLASPSGMRRRSQDFSLLGRPPAVPSVPRASTVYAGKSSAQKYYNPRPKPRSNPRSRSGSRRSVSQRDLSPRSARPLRSSPNSRRSFRSSLSDSDDETDLTRPTPDIDDNEDNVAASVFGDRQTLRDRMNVRKRPSQEYPPPASTAQKKMPKQKQKARLSRRDQQEQDQQRDPEQSQSQPQRQEQGQDHEQESSILPQAEYQPPRKRSNRRRRSRRSSDSRGGGGSSRGRRRGSIILEEEAARHQEEGDDYDAEMGNNDSEDDRRRARTPSRHGRRSVSRHTTTTQDLRREMSRSKSRLRRAESDEFNARSASIRPKSRHCESELPNPYVPATLRRAQTHPTAPSHVTAPPTIELSRRPSSLFESPLGVAPHAFSGEKSSKRSGCLMCMEEFPSSRMAKLKCGHRMCGSCLKKKFRASMSDRRQMPPRCCTIEPIGTKHVEKLFDVKFKQDWNRRFRETSTAARIYCPSSRCGEWIKPENMFREEDREIARCPRCHTRVCCLCNNRAHASHECPHDEKTMRLLDAVRAGGPQRCYKCKAVLELQDGRNHIVCPCGAESCMICGTQWTHCDCPVFDCDAPSGGSVYGDYEHTQYAQSATRRSRFGYASSSAPRDFYSSTKAERPYSTGDSVHPRTQSYDEKSRLRSRMDDYRADDLSRRMGSLRGLADDEGMADGYEPTLFRERMDRDVDQGRYSARRQANDDLALRPRRRRSFVDEDYEERAATDILPSVPQPPPAPPTPPQQQVQSAPPPHRYQHHAPQEQHPRPAPTPPSQYPTPAYERANGAGDYYMNGGSRTRAVHADSQVGRLADRFNAGPRSSPMHRPSAPPGLPVTPMAASMPMGGVPMGPMSPVGPLPLMPPMVAMPPPPPPPPAMMAAMPMMPMAPMPPQAVMPEMPMMMRHTMEEDPFMSGADMRSGGMRGSHYLDAYGEVEADVFASGSSRRHRRREEAASSQHPQHTRTSEMAGLAGPGRGMDRVPEWMEFIGRDPPEDDPESILEQ